MDCLIKNNFLLKLLILLTVFLGICGGVAVFSVLKAYLFSGTLLIICALFTVVKCDLRKAKKVLKNKKLIPIFGFFLWTCVSTTVFGVHLESIDVFIKFLFLFLFFMSLFVFVIFDKISMQDISRICSCVNILICSAVFFKMTVWGWGRIYDMNNIGAVQSGNGFYSTYIYNVFYTPPFSNSQNYVSSYIVTLIGLGFIGNDYKDKKYLFLCIISIFFGGGVIILSLSKTAIIGLVILWFFLLMCKWKYAVGVAVITSLLFLCNPLNISNGVLNRFNIVNSIQERVEADFRNKDVYENKTVDDKLSDDLKVTEDIETAKTNINDNEDRNGRVLSNPTDFPYHENINNIDDNSVTSRIALWKTAVELIKHHPLIGNGFRTTRMDFAKAVPEDPHVNHPHNLYLQIMVDQGIIGLILFSLTCIGLLATIIKGMRSDSKEHACYMMLLGVFVFHIFRGIFGFQLEELDTWLLFFVIMSCTCDKLDAKEA